MFWLSLVILLHSICRLYCKASVFDRRIIERLWKGASDCGGLIFINCQFWCIFTEILIFLRSAKMKRSMSFSDMFVCCAAFCAFTFVCDCICLRSCYIVLLSCFLSFVVLPVSFYSDFTLLPVLCLIRAPSQSSRLVFAWPRLALICHVLFCSCRFRLPLRVAFSFCFLRVVFL